MFVCYVLLRKSLHSTAFRHYDLVLMVVLAVICRNFDKKEGKGLVVAFCSDRTVKIPFAWTIETCFF